MKQEIKIDDAGEVITDIYMDIKQTEKLLVNQAKEEDNLRTSINEINKQLEELSAQLNIPYTENTLANYDINSLNLLADTVAADFKCNNKFKFSLSSTDYIVASLSGIVAVAIDVIFVGTPEVVKLYRGGENFDGSRLTELIRTIKPDESAAGTLLTWLSNKCKVPYDISCLKGVVTPNNHRIRGLAHDPFFGLFFAIADIFMGTTTCIDNSGKINIIFNYETSTTEKLLSVIYYVGHIISDIFTARGIPIPGFFLTQFFTDGTDSDPSIAKIAEGMYKDGYDLRHLASMATPVAVEHLIIEIYTRLAETNNYAFVPLAEKEIVSINKNIHKDSMVFIANSIGIAGNITKFVLPPVCCNPCALNIVQWTDFIKYSLKELQILRRDKSAEEILSNRCQINAEWNHLLNA